MLQQHIDDLAEEKLDMQRALAQQVRASFEMCLAYATEAVSNLQIGCSTSLGCSSSTLLYLK